MSRVVAKFRGEEIGDIVLEDGQEYIAGRGSECDIVLGEQRGISRQHLKFFQRDGVWLVESLSRFIPINLGDEAHETIELSQDAVFSIPPYDFYFFSENGDAAKDEPESAPDMGLHSPKLPTFSESHKPAQPVDESDGDTSAKFNMDATQAGAVTLVPYLKITSPNSTENEVLKLEGNHWIAGRESTCEIFLDDQRVSRKHFEMARTNEGFFVTDLGSSNGTKVNGIKIPPHEPKRVESGDSLSVLQIEMVFEIHDVLFSDRVSNLPAVVPAGNQMMPGFPSPWGQQAMMPYQFNPQFPVPFEESKGLVLKDRSTWTKENLRKVNWKKNFPRIAIGLLIPVLLIGLVSGGKKKEKPANPNTSDAFDKMTKDQKAAIQDTFNLARNLYTQGKYELCLTELAKLHEMIPVYKNSKELQAFCNQGHILVQRKRDQERKQREKAMVTKKIDSIIAGCKFKLKGKGSVDETRSCLSGAIELNPEEPRVVEMIQNAQSRVEEQKLIAKQRAERVERRQRALSIYHRAKSLYKTGDLLKSIEEYNRFLDAYATGLSEEKKLAHRDIASIHQKIDVQIKEFLDQCKSLGDKHDYKNAYLACDKALKVDPKNEAARTARDTMLRSLQRQMKAIYEDSVLEESLGNVDSAKVKWQKIVQEDLEFDDYTKKAKIKLRRYGFGF